MMCFYAYRDSFPDETDRFTVNRTTEETSMQTLQTDYFAAYRNLKLSRDAKGVLVAEFHSDGGPFIMNTQAHTEQLFALEAIDHEARRLREVEVGELRADRGEPFDRT